MNRLLIGTEKRSPVKPDFLCPLLMEIPGHGTSGVWPINLAASSKPNYRQDFHQEVLSMLYRKPIILEKSTLLFNLKILCAALVLILVKRWLFLNPIFTIYPSETQKSLVDTNQSVGCSLNESKSGVSSHEQVNPPPPSMSPCHLRYRLGAQPCYPNFAQRPSSSPLLFLYLKFLLLISWTNDPECGKKIIPHFFGG